LIEFVFKNFVGWERR